MIAGQTKSHPVHGGLNLAELRLLGLDPQNVIDFSASINPLGTPPIVRQALQRIDFAAYPDPDCQELREALSIQQNVAPDSILIGNGSTELIHLVARAYLDEGDAAFIFAPTFGEYDAGCRVQGVEPTYFIANESQSFRWDISKALEAIEHSRPKLVFLCNPNNPTGVYLDEDAVHEVAHAVHNNGLLVLDEAYLSFVDDAWDSKPLLDVGNVILLRSMTKDYAIPGLRLGCMMAPPDIVERVRRFQPSWSVNAAAQAAGIACLKDAAHLENGKEAVRIGKSYLTKELVDLGIAVLPSTANFLLVKIGDATGIRLRLLKQGVCVRDCTSFGLPQYIRIGMRKLEDCEKLIASLKKVLTDG